MNEQKLEFLRYHFIPLIEQLESGSQARWGKMNAQQMIEHMAMFLQVSTNRLHFPLVTPPDLLPKFREFLLSEKEFRENTKAPVLGDEPEPLQFEKFADSQQFLRNELNEFFSFFANNPQAITQSPTFGNLSYEDWVLLQYKHAIHHLKQFGITI